MSRSSDHADTPDGFDHIPVEDFQDDEGLCHSDLSAAAARKIDGLCDEFEKAWTASKEDPPELEAFWTQGRDSDLSESDGRILLKELLIIDLNYRKSENLRETINFDDYVARFPGCQSLIAEAFERAGLDSTAGFSVPASQDTSRVPVETSSEFQLLPPENSDPETDARLKSTINEIPQQLGGYGVEAVLGQGGMGVVYRAHDHEMNRTVAIKVMKEDRIGSQEAMERFRREIRLLANLDHENIVRAYHTHVDEATQTRYLVMEYVEGVELETLVDPNHRLSISNACEIIRQAAMGLEHAHENGLIHRDLKPANLMLTAKGLVKVLDLGLARPQNAESADGGVLLTQEGQWLGTPYYMSPEQGTAPGTIDRRSDIYSLGCTLFRFLAGRCPFEGATVYAILMQHAKEPFPSVTKLRPDVPRGLERILQRMVEKSSDKRWPSAAEVARRLKPYCKGSDLPALFQAYHSGDLDSPPKRSAKGSKRGAIVVGLLAVLLIAAAVVWFSRPKTEPRPPVDLLAEIDINRDPVKGDWRLETGVLKSPPDSGLASIRLPKNLPAEFRLEVTARLQSEDQFESLTFVHRGEQTPFVLSLMPPRVTPVDHQPEASQDEKSAAIMEEIYEVWNPNPQTFVFDVKADRLTITRDGEMLSETTEYPPLSKEIPGVPNRPGFYLVVDDSEHEFSKILLTVP